MIRSKKSGGGGDNTERVICKLSQYYSISIDTILDYTRSRIKVLNNAMFSFENPKEYEKEKLKEKKKDMLENPQNYTKQEIKTAFS